MIGKERKKKIKKEICRKYMREKIENGKNRQKRGKKNADD